MVQDILEIIRNGENSLVEFKEASVSPQALAEEVVAFANGRGGAIYIGVSDEGAILGIDETRKSELEAAVMNICRNNIRPPLIPLYETIRMDDRWIARITISEGIEKPYQTVQGKYLVRAGTTKRLTSREELLRLFQNARAFHLDDYPIPGSRPEHLDMTKISRYFRDIYDLNLDQMEGAEKERLLINACILGRIQGKTCATVTGLIFFSASGQPFSPLERFLPQAGIQFVAYEDDDVAAILDRLDVYRACPEAIDDVVQKLRINWKTPSRVAGLRREELPFPAEIFRELIVNGVIHRDYSISSAIQIRMFPNRVEVATPGRLVNTVTVARMRAGISVLRNPILVKFMQHYRYADQLGRGIPMILRRIEKLGGLALDLIAEEERFVAVLRREGQGRRKSEE